MNRKAGSPLQIPTRGQTRVQNKEKAFIQKTSSGSEIVL